MSLAPISFVRSSLLIGVTTHDTSGRRDTEVGVVNLYPSSAKCCGADVTMETTMQSSWRSGQAKRAKQVFHHRRLDGARFWHWSDQEVAESPIFIPIEGTPSMTTGARGRTQTTRGVGA